MVIPMGCTFLPPFFLAWLILIASTSARDFGYSPEDLLSEDRTVSLYESWLAKHNKAYTLAEEKQQRYEIFKDNLRYIDEVNQKNLSYWLGLNKYADISHDEFKSTYLSNVLQRFTKPTGYGGSFRYENVTDDDLPTSLDWRTKGAVTPVKYQNQCGSCWAFTVAGAVESINHIATGKLVSLSEQELIDCTTTNKGCNGGVVDFGYQFIIDNKGISSESTYPYTGIDGQCRTDKLSAKVATIDKYEDVPENNPQAFLKALVNQPLSIGVDASSLKFLFYQGGVLSGSCGTHINHGLIAVGFGQEDGSEYIIAKNSWGTEWGEKGYIKIDRSIGWFDKLTGKKRGHCGIYQMVAYPIKN